MKFKTNALLNTGMIIIFIMELLFVKMPIEISYLLPQYLIAVPLIVFMVQPRKAILNILIALTISSGFIINPDVLDRKYNATGSEAISAEQGIFIRPGIVIDDILKREVSEKTFTSMYSIDVL